MTGTAPKMRVTPADFTHCPNPDWAAMTALAERFGDAVTEMMMGLHPTPPEAFSAHLSQVDLVAELVQYLHKDVANGHPIDTLTLAMICACIWNRQQPAQGA